MSEKPCIIPRVSISLEKESANNQTEQQSERREKKNYEF